MKKLSLIIFSIWGLIASVISLVIVYPIYILIFWTKGEKYFNPAHQLSIIWAKYLMSIWISYPTIIGKDKLDKTKTYIIVSNHCSQTDIPLAAIATDNHFKFLAKQELTKIPLLGKIIEKMYLTVERKSMRDKAKAMIKMRDCLNSGISVWIFPEGTRNKNGTGLGEINDGAFQLAVQTGYPLAICKFSGTSTLLPPGKFQFTPTKIIAEWFEPLQGKSLEELREEFSKRF